MKAANIFQVGQVGIAGGLSHVDALTVHEFPIEVSTLDVNLVQLKVLVCDQGEDSVNRC